MNIFAARITKTIKTAANVAIPQTCPKKTEKKSRLFGPSLQDLRKQKQVLWHNYKTFQNCINLAAYKKARALFKREAIRPKRESFGNFTANIKPLSTTKKIWADVNKLVDIFSEPLKSIRENNVELLNSIYIGNPFGAMWSNYSKDENFSNEYKTNKENFLSLASLPNHISSDAKHLVSQITLNELESVLQHAKGKTLGYERIWYTMLRNLPIEGKQRFIEIYNKISVCLENGYNYPNH